MIITTNYIKEYCQLDVKPVYKEEVLQTLIELATYDNPEASITYRENLNSNNRYTITVEAAINTVEEIDLWEYQNS